MTETEHVHDYVAQDDGTQTCSDEECGARQWQDGSDLSFLPPGERPLPDSVVIPEPESDDTEGSAT